MSCYNSASMIPESELMAQARRALREERLEDAQGILVNVVISEPRNDEAWLMLAETLQDPARKMECLENARRIDPRNPVTLRAIQALQNEAAAENTAQDSALPAAPDPAPTQPPTIAPEIPTRANLIEPLLQEAELAAKAIMMSVEPAEIRNLGVELVTQIEQAILHDETAARRWARSAGRDALVKYERGLSTLITNLPMNDPYLAALREQRQRALELFKVEARMNPPDETE